MHFAVEREIGASPEKVWSILTDKSKLLTGGFGIVKLEGDIVANGRIKLWSSVNPNRAFPLRITQFEAGRQMTWEGGMPLGLFKGVRQFKISPTGRGSHFSMREDYSGPLSGMIMKSIPDLTPSFNTFADALKRAAEGA